MQSCRFVIMTQIPKFLGEAFLEELPDVIAGIPERPIKTGPYTKGILRSLREMGERADSNITVFPDRSLGYLGREYLVDLLWVREVKGRKEVLLACESQMKPNIYIICWDLDKILFLNAENRLLLCAAGPKSREHYIRKIVENIQMVPFRTGEHQGCVEIIMQTPLWPWPKDDLETSRIFEWNPMEVSRRALRLSYPYLVP